MKNQQKLEKIFTLRGAKCLGEVYDEEDNLPFGFLFRIEDKVVLLQTSGFSMGIEEDDSLIFRLQKDKEVFKKIFGSRYFEETLRGRWILHKKE